MGGHASTKPYSEDLPIRIVKAVEEGTSKSATARLFDVSLSSVKRYVRSASRGESLAPGKGGGRSPKADRTAQKRLEEDAKERPAATVSERRRFLEQLAGEASSDPTIRRLLKRPGFGKKRSVGAAERDEFLRAVWRKMVSGRAEPKRFVFVDEMGANTTSLSPLSTMPGRGAARGRGVLCLATAGRAAPRFRA